MSRAWRFLAGYWALVGTLLAIASFGWLLLLTEGR